MATLPADFKILPFKVHSTDGGDDGNNGYEIANVVDTNSSKVHCTVKAINVNIILEHTVENEFTATHIVARAPPGNFTSLLRTGLVFITNDVPSNETLTLYDNYDEVKFNALKSDKSETLKPVAFFSIQSKYAFVKLEAPTNGRYVTFKLLTASTDENIDVEYLGVCGFTSKIPVAELPTKLQEVAEVEEKTGDSVGEILKLITIPKRFCLLDKATLEIFSNNTTMVLLPNLSDSKEGNEKLKEILKNVAYCQELKQKDMYFQYCDEALIPRLVEFIGLKGAGPHLLISSDNNRYVFQEKTISEQLMKEFCQNFIDGKLLPFVKSQDRPENDADPTHPGLTIVVSSSFDEIVLNEEKDVFLDVYADWCGPCRTVAPHIINVAHVLKNLGVKNITICKLDCDSNQTNKKYLPETTIPNIKLFPKGKQNKENSIKYSAQRNAPSILQFLHDNASEKFDLPAALENLKKIEEEEEHKKLKNVIKIHSMEEYKNKLQNNADKLIVVDFFATWCGPCNHIAPAFADFSEKYPNCIFLKVDVDVNKNISTEAGVTCMPTFHFIKNGEKITQIEGADTDTLKEYIEKYK
jgi:thioredoxin 1